MKKIQQNNSFSTFGSARDDTMYGIPTFVKKTGSPRPYSYEFNSLLKIKNKIGGA